jgi:hypothetical protein
MTVDKARSAASAGQAEGAAPTSLVLIGESVGEICPRNPRWVVADSDPARRYPASCDSYGCEVCGPRKARQKAALMTWAAGQPQVWAGQNRARLVTLTQLPTCPDGSLDWQRSRSQVRDYLRRVRRDYPRFDVGWAIERNPKLTGYHAHLLQHGSYVPQRFLADLWGGRRVDVRALSRPEAGVYAIKEAVKVAGYVVKNGKDNFVGLQEHLAINGWRAAHFSRGFLHGLTSREASLQLAQSLSSSDETWHLELATEWLASRYPETCGVLVA